MVSSLKCECSNRYEMDINSISDFNEINMFFDEQVKKGIYLEEQAIRPYYVWTDGKDYKEYYATKWYKCMACGCLWEFKFPDFPAKGFVKKYVDGIYSGTVIVNNNEESKTADIVIKSKRNNSVYYMFSDEIFIHDEKNKSIGLPADLNVVGFCDMYYQHDELYVIVATNKGYDYVYILDEEDNSIKKRGLTK